MAPAASPRRRSQRFQPFLEEEGQNGLHSRDKYRWISAEPLYVRLAAREDFFEIGRERWDKAKREDGCGDHQVTTSFYDGFFVPQGKWGKLKNKVSEGEAIFRVGDTVLVDTGAKVDSIAVIVAMWETSVDEEDRDEVIPEPTMKVKVHWFLRPIQLPSVRARRIHAENEIYFSLASSAVLAPSRIKDHCTVSIKPATTMPSQVKRPRLKALKNEGNPNNPAHFYCHLAIDSQRGFFFEFDWEKHHAAAKEIGREPSHWGSGEEWHVALQKADASPRKKVPKGQSFHAAEEENESSAPGLDEDGQESSEVDDGDIEAPSETETSESDQDEVEDVPKTPSRKRRRAQSTVSMSKHQSNQLSTPRTPHKPRQKPAAHPTPHSKKALSRRASRVKKQALMVRPPPPEPLSPRKKNRILSLPQDPWLRAMHALHVGARPEEVQLPGREEEYAKILGSVEELIAEGSGGCVYISGMPGSGKTATVHAIVRELKRMAEENETNPFTYAEINGLKISEPSAAYALLWEAVSGHDTTRDGRLNISSKEALKNLTKHFSGTVRGPGEHACVVLMDELDQLVTTKQDVVYNFFNWPTIAGSGLVVIAVANTMDLPERVMSGRVRSRMGMVRINFQPYTTLQLQQIVQSRLAIASEGLGSQAKEVIETDGIRFAAMYVSRISGDARRVLDICRRTVELVHPHRRAARTNDVQEVIKVLQNSPTAAYLRECSFHERAMLAAIIKCVKREGVEEVKWGDVQRQHQAYIPIFNDSNITFKPSAGELTMILDSLLASRAILIEDGVAAARKADDERKVVLNLEQAEVERVLGDVGGARWRNALSS